MRQHPTSVRARTGAPLRALLAPAFVAAAALGAAPAAAQAPAPITVWAEAGFEDPAFSNPLTFRAYAEAEYGTPTLRGSAFARESPLPYGDPWLASVEPSNQIYSPCGDFVVPGFPCVNPPTSSSFMVDASTGALRGYARASDYWHMGEFELGLPHAGTGGAIGDTISILSGNGLTFRIALDSRHRADANNEPLVTLPTTSFVYSVVVWVDPSPDCDWEDTDCDGRIASFDYSASRDGFAGVGQGYATSGSFQVLGDNLFGASARDANAFVDLFLPNPGQPFYLAVAASVRASCETRNDPIHGIGNDCHAWVEAEQSAYLQIVGHYSSANGFAYLGPVPEPQTAALWLAGLSALGFVARRRRTG